MSKYASNLAYIEEGQCNDVSADTRPPALELPPALPARRRQARPSVLRRWWDAIVALLTFGAQVAAVFLVIVLIAKVWLR